MIDCPTKDFNSTVVFYAVHTTGSDYKTGFLHFCKIVV